MKKVYQTLEVKSVKKIKVYLLQCDTGHSFLTVVYKDLNVVNCIFNLRWDVKIKYTVHNQLQVSSFYVYFV